MSSPEELADCGSDSNNDEISLRSTGRLSKDGEAATAQSLRNVTRVLEAAGLGLEHVVKATVFLIDSGDYAGMDATYRTTVPEPFPAREAVFVAGLPKGARVEISVIAHRNR